jgi:hypothetical protein
MDNIMGFLAKKVFQIDGFTLTVLGVVVLVVVLWFVFARK